MTPGLGDKFYLRLLRGEAEPAPLPLEGGCAEDDSILLLGDDVDDDVPVPQPKAMPRPKAAAKAALRHPDLLPIEGSPEPVPPAHPIVGGHAPPVAAGGSGLPPLGPELAVPGLGGDGALLGPVEPGPIGRLGAVHRKPRRKFIATVDGAEAYLDRYDPEGDAVGYENWIVRFMQNGRKWERKRHVTTESTRGHGEIEPRAYLHAIKARIVADDPHFLTHARAQPDPADVAEQVRLHEPVFLATVASFALVG